MGYRMIIADDEEMLIQLIKKLGKYEELGIEIVDECHDGEEAFGSIIRHRPDFVLTDIQMPVLDGLEMIEKVQERVPDTLFVLISGYRYFEYARSAIQLNVADYLLKPVNADQLNQILERLCHLTDERQRQKRDRETLRMYRDTMTREKYNRFWNVLLADEPQREALVCEPDELKRRYDIEFPHDCFRLLMLDYNLSQVSEMGRFSFVDKLNEAACAAFEDRVKYYVYEQSNRFLILLNFDRESFGTMRTTTSVFFYSCKDLHEVFGSFRLTLGLSNTKYRIIELPEAVGEAEAASWGWLYFNGDQVIRYEQVVKMPRIDVSRIFSEDRRKRLQDCIRYLKAKDLGLLFSEMKLTVNDSSYIYPGDIARLYKRMRRQIEGCVSQDHREKLLRECDAALKSAWEPMQVFKKVYMVLENYIEEQQMLLEKAGRNPVKRAQEYILRNYSKSISLESVAESVGISGTYLSKMFKEINGVGFSEYLTAVRLEESQKLLAETGLSIREVAASVGYCDEKYYSKLFKKQFGIKPTEYRRLYG